MLKLFRAFPNLGTSQTHLNAVRKLIRWKSSNSSPVHRLLRGSERAIAYRVLMGANPGIIFCPGFQSNMLGIKSMALEAYCRTKGLAFTCFDYQGCGQSLGDIRDVTFSDWKGDVISILDQVTAGPQIMVGSSMGAWLMFLAAMERQHRIHALVGIASAPDFSQRAFQRFTPEALEELRNTGETILDTEYGKYVITQRFLDDLEQHNLLNRPNLPLTCPVRLLHGMADHYVPYEFSLRLCEKIQSDDILVLLRKQGDHRFSQPQDIQVLFEELDYLVVGPRDTRDLALTAWSAFSVYAKPENNIKK